LKGWNLSSQLSPRGETSHQIVGSLSYLAFFETVNPKSFGRRKINENLLGLTLHSLGTVITQSKSTDQVSSNVYNGQRNEGDINEN
jgi:hypothetical protein